MARHSERAKKNSRDGINLRILTIESRITGIKREITLLKRYGHSPFTRRLAIVLKRKLKKRQSQVARYYARKRRLKNQGKI